MTKFIGNTQSRCVFENKNWTMNLNFWYIYYFLGCLNFFYYQISPNFFLLSKIFTRKCIFHVHHARDISGVMHFDIPFSGSKNYFFVFIFFVCMSNKKSPNPFFLFNILLIFVPEIAPRHARDGGVTAETKTFKVNKSVTT